jgi:predicted glycosyltransferase
VNGSILFYVQHLLGIGHLRRALYLVDAMARLDLAVTLVSGGEPLPDLAGVKVRRLVQLSPIRAIDATFGNLASADGQPPDDRLWTARREALLTAFGEAEPDAVVIEAYPFGRRAFRRELEPLVAAARGRRPRALVICSLRDIVIAPTGVSRLHEIVERVQRDFDAVLVHGDERLIALVESFPPAVQIADRVVYTGYVTGPEPAVIGESDAGADEVLVSAGGGAVGGELLRTAVAARRRGRQADAGWRLLTGPNLPAAEFAALTAELPDGVIVERYRNDFAQMLRRCRVSISQAGYNTVLDIIGAGVPAVLVPFAEIRESEQTLRAQRLAERGVVEMLSSAALSPERLGEAIERAIRRGPAALRLDTNGASRAAAIVADMVRGRANPGTFRQIEVAGG